MRLAILSLVMFLAFFTSAQHDHLHDHNAHKEQQDVDRVIPSVLEHITLELDNSNMISDWTLALEPHLIDLGVYGAIEVVLEPTDIKSSDYFTLTDQGHRGRGSDARTFKGFSPDGGHVRLTVDEQFTYGYIEYNDERYWIEPAWYYIDQEKNNDVVVYKQSNVEEDHSRACGVSETALKAKELQTIAEETQQNDGARLGQCYLVEIAAASDFSMYTKYNSSTADVENHHLAVLNNVNGDYTGTFDDDIVFVYVTQWFSTCSGCDPWTTSTDAVTVLQSFTMWGQTGAFMTNYDLGQFWTDREFDGPTVGIAWVGELCTNFRYHCLQDFSSNANVLRVMTSHEIGHNFDSDHAPVSGFIMSATLSITSDWHPNSLGDINPYINFIANQGGCFSACPAGNAPQPAFEALADNICPGTTIKFFDRSTNDPTAWSWSFPGGTPASSTNQHPSVSYFAPGNYSVFLEVSNGAGSNAQTFTNVVQVGSGGQSFPLYQDFDNGFEDWSVENPDNSATWEIISPVSAPGGTSTAFINNFAYPNIGQRDAIISPEFSLAGYQFASLHVEYAHAASTSGAGDSLIIAVSGDGGASFQRFYANAENGSGNFATSTPSAAAFNPQALTDWCGLGGFGANCIDVDISNYLGSREVIVRIENFTNSGNNTYIDRVYVTGDCFNLPPPVADFTASPQEGCAPLVVQFTDQSQNSPFSWQWTFENGSPATSTDPNPEVVYSTPGEYAVTLTVTNESGTDISVQNSFIQVLGLPIAGFSATTNGAIATFTNLSVDADDFLWDFGDGNTSMDENPIHTYAMDGTYLVVLQVFNDCGMDEFTANVTIGTPPMANYEHGDLTGCVPATIQFLNTSSMNSTSVQWFFEGGDPASSTLNDPLVSYDTPGEYDVTLIAMNGAGSDTIIDENVVVMGEAPQADFSYTIAGLEVTFTNESNAGSYEWFFGDGNTSMDENPVHTYATEDIYTVMLVVSNACGQDTSTQTVSLGGLPSADIVVGQTSGCAPLTVDFDAENARSTDIIRWTFDGGNPSTSTLKSPTVVYDAPGLYDVELIVSNSLGADTTVMLEWIDVQGPPLPDFTYVYDGFLTFEFTYTGEDFTAITWDFGDGNTSNMENPTYQYSEDISNGILISVLVENGCGSNLIERTVTFTEPIVQVGVPQTPNCVGQQVSFLASGTNNNPTYSWTFDGGTPATSNLANPVVTYSQSGVYDVSLIATQNGASLAYNFVQQVVIEDEPEADFIPSGAFMENMSMNASSFAWIVNGMFESDEEDYTISGSGEFIVDLVAYNSCGSDTSTQNVTISSVENIASGYQGMTIFPNPNDGQFTMQFEQAITVEEVIIFDIKGNEIKRSVPILNQAEHRDLAVGVYLIKAVTSDGIYLAKLAIVK